MNNRRTNVTMNFSFPESMPNRPPAEEYEIYNAAHNIPVGIKLSVDMVAEEKHFNELLASKGVSESEFKDYIKNRIRSLITTMISTFNLENLFSDSKKDERSNKEAPLSIYLKMMLLKILNSQTNGGSYDSDSDDEDSIQRHKMFFNVLVKELVPHDSYLRKEIQAAALQKVRNQEAYQQAKEKIEQDAALKDLELASLQKTLEIEQLKLKIAEAQEKTKRLSANDEQKMVNKTTLFK